MLSKLYPEVDRRSSQDRPLVQVTRATLVFKTNGEWDMANLTLPPHYVRLLTEALNSSAL